MSIEEHLNDIDFRSWEQRSQEYKTDFVNWFKLLQIRAMADPFNERLQGQITMLSSVLWYILTPKEYKALVHVKAGKPTDSQPPLL